MALGDITNSNTAKAMHSIRTLASITDKDDKTGIYLFEFKEPILTVTAPLSKAVAEIIRTSGLVSTNEIKVDESKSLKKRRSSKLLVSQIYLPSEAFWAIRSKFSSPETALLGSIVKGINSKDRVTARHCSVLAYELAKVEPEAAMSAFIVCVGGNNTITSLSTDGIEAASAAIHRNDETVRHYWVKVCGLLGHLTNLAEYLSFRNELYDFLYDVSDRVAFIAIEEILRGTWKDISKASLSDIQNPSSEVKVLDMILKRLIQGLANPNTPVVHMAARISKLLAERLAQSFEETPPTNNVLSPFRTGGMLTRPSSSRKKPRSTSSVTYPNKVNTHSLRSLENTLTSLLESTKSQSVRVQVLCALVWMADSENAKDISTFIMKERNNLPTHMLDIVFKEILKRAKSSSIFVEIVLDIFYKLYCTVPSKLNPKLLMKTWKRVMRIGEQHRQKVLFNIFCFLETPHKRETKSITINIQKIIFWFLGEEANLLTGERCTLVSEKDFVTIESELKEIITNSSMDAIVSKLESSIVHSPWETRVVCLEALAKIAFLSGFPVRVRVYEFLLKCVKNDKLCIYPIAIHILRALEKIFNVRKRWVVVLNYGKKFKNTDEKKVFLNELDSMKQAISPFCDVSDQGYLEPDLLEFLEANKKLRTKRRKKKQDEE